MQEGIGAGENLKTHTVQNGDIPLNYCSANMNGKEIAFCLSKEDYFTAQKLGEEMPKAALLNFVPAVSLSTQETTFKSLFM